MSNYQLTVIAIVLALSAILTGCITVKEGGGSIDKQKLIDNYVRLGMAYLQQDSRDAARRNFEKALAINSKSAPANNGMALLYQLNAEFSLAEKYYLKAISSDASYTQAKNNYGIFLYRQARYQEAYDVFKDVVEDLSYVHREHALAQFGRAALKIGKRERAKSLFHHSLNINNKVLISNIELAEIYFDEENYAESKRYLDQYLLFADRQSPQSLWLGIRIERIFGNKDKEASYALALRNLHPYSNEYLQYQATLDDEQK